MAEGGKKLREATEPKLPRAVKVPTVSIGRIVHYKLSRLACHHIESKRAKLEKETPGARSGYVSLGNDVSPGMVFPMIVVAVREEDYGHKVFVNGQVFLDGVDTLWMTGVERGDGNGQWQWPKIDAG